MLRALWLPALVLGILGCTTAVSLSTAADEKKDKGTVVTLDGLSSRTPAEWKEQEPDNKMRFAQFSLPKAKDDKSDAELVIFKGLGGTAKDNIERWKAQ